MRAAGLLTALAICAAASPSPANGNPGRAGAAQNRALVAEITLGRPGEFPYDDNGNLTDDGSRVLVWDAFNRLVGVARRSDGAPVAAYFYLPDGRRSRKVVYSQTTPGVVEREVRFVWDGAQEVEEQSAAGVTLATFVWSPVYVDELVEFRREAAHPLGAGSFFAHQDARCDVVAVTDGAGQVVERRRYDDFGREEIRDAGGAVVPASPSGLEYGFQGRRRDAETGWVYFRARYYSAEEGRFLSRDPVWDAGNVGGWYSFAGNGPVSGRDPFGDQAIEAKQSGPDMPPLLDPSAGRQGLTLEEKAAVAAAAALVLYVLTKGRTPPPPTVAPAPPAAPATAPSSAPAPSRPGTVQLPPPVTPQSQTAAGRAGSAPIPRVGTPAAKPNARFEEVPLSDLQPLHGVPRAGKPENYIQDLARSIRAQGYRLDQAIPVIRLPDGRLVSVGGHHRAEAMRISGERTIPAQIRDWTTLSPATQRLYVEQWPETFGPLLPPPPLEPPPCPKPR